MDLDIDLNVDADDIDLECLDQTALFNDASSIETNNEDHGAYFSQAPREPEKGMEFNSRDEAFEFYRIYAKYFGFGVSTIKSRRSRSSKEFIDARFACTRFGIKRPSKAINPRSCFKMDCKALLHVKRISDGKWVVHEFMKEHNHELCPDRAYCFPCHRGISIANQSEINALHVAGIAPGTIHAVLAEKHKGHKHVGCSVKDIRNYIDKERRLTLQIGDANVMLQHFIEMQQKDPKFFYAIDLDEERRLRNVFWVNGKGREDYEKYFDVVSFDTTYITNKYKMPFAPFIGVNNHFQSTILGCALLADETRSTFVWLMETWMRAMNGKAPKAILTDQDRAMKAAIEHVFPNTCHRFCLWHIMRKVPEKLGHVTKMFENFMGAFKRCIYKTWTGDEFEDGWKKMIKNFEFLEGEKEWLQSLYDDRKQWVPTYMRETFFGGMSTTQRSESINSFFDKYVNKKTSLTEFVVKYKQAVKDREKDEEDAEFNSQKKPYLKTRSPFEKQLSTVYTYEVFRKFQVEISGVVGCYATLYRQDEHEMVFKVREFETEEDFMVTWNSKSEDVECLCRSFEFKGFLCRHCLCVLYNIGIFLIPPKYILSRWTKNDVKSKQKSAQRNEVQYMEQNSRKMQILTSKISDEALYSEASYNFAYSALEEILRKCIDMNKSKRLCFGNTGKENCDYVRDPEITRTKGAPKRIKAGIEIASKRRCKTQKRKVLGELNNLGNQEQSHQTCQDTQVSSSCIDYNFSKGTSNANKSIHQMFPELTDLMSSHFCEEGLSLSP